MKVSFAAIASIIVASLAACSPSEVSNDAGAGGVGLEGYEVGDARIRPPLGGRDVTGATFTIVSAADDQLVGARSEIADAVEVHIHEMDDGLMRMRRVEAFDLPAGQTISREDRGLHLMLFGVPALEDGDMAEIVFEFASGAEKSVMFDVATPAEAGGMKH